KLHRFFFFIVCMFLLLSGCGKHKCAICGKMANCKLMVGGQEYDLCRDCYETYVEEQHLFDEEL
ncbi:MAG: hypothetical protein K2N63_11660, partial [Lachnospiraceae bacterium]|nr:hypothetical protein [Lachnospiraceae bacterium]